MKMTENIAGFSNDQLNFDGNYSILTRPKVSKKLKAVEYYLFCVLHIATVISRIQFQELIMIILGF